MADERQALIWKVERVAQGLGQPQSVAALLLQLVREVDELRTQQWRTLDKLNKLLEDHGWNPVEGDNG